MNLVKVSKTNFIFLFFLALTLIYIIFTLNKGEAQDKVFNADYQYFQNANDLWYQGKFSESAPIYYELIKTHPDSYLLSLNYADALAGQGKYQEARKYYDKTRTQRPFIVSEPSYLYEYSRVSYELGEYKDARRYLLRAKIYTEDVELLIKINGLLDKTESKLEQITGEKNG